MEYYNNILNLYYDNLISNYSETYINNYQSIINTLSNYNVKQQNITKFNFNLLEDLDLFSINGIFDKLNFTQTIIGKITFQKQLLNPSYNYNYLIKKQIILKKWLKNKKILTNLIKKIKKLSKNESDLIWFLNEPTKELKELLNNLYFKWSFLKWINKNNFLQKCFLFYKIYLSPFNLIFIPLVSFLVFPYLFLRYFYKIPITIKLYYSIVKILLYNYNFLNLYKTSKIQFLFFTFSILSYIYQFYQSIMFSIKLKNIIKLLKNKINYFKDIVEIIIHVIENKNLYELLTFDMKKDLELIKTYQIIDLIKNTNTFSEVVTNYLKIKDNKKQLLDIYKFIGKLDSLCSHNIIIIKFSYFKNKFCFTNFNKDSNKIEINDFWNPLINKDKIVTNSIILNKNKNNINLITGPNSGGKSIIIKTILLNILLSQTLTFAPCKKISLQPFHLIESYISTPDIVGYKSLFEAEIYRVKEFINKLEELKKINKNYNSLIIMDELFNSTNHEEGLLASLTILKLLNKNYSNNISLITTHYHKLANILDKEKNVQNYCVKYDNKKNIFNYKLYKGINKQKMALYLVEKLFK